MAKSSTAASSPTGFGTQDNSAARSAPPVGTKKTVCPIDRATFRGKAKPQLITVGTIPMVAEAKEFSTGSLGWYLNGKTVIEIDGVPVSVQIGMNLTIVGSKELPAG